MKKFITILLFATSVLLAGEISISPLMHNHTDLVEHNTCPAFLLTSNQVSDSGEFFVSINIIAPQHVVFIHESNILTPYSSLFHTTRNKAPPVM